MAKVTFNDEICKGCSLCVNACPQKILRLSSRTNAKGYCVAECADHTKCIGCAMCYTMCPDCVITVEK